MTDTTERNALDILRAKGHGSLQNTGGGCMVLEFNRESDGRVLWISANDPEGFCEIGEYSDGDAPYAGEPDDYRVVDSEAEAIRHIESWLCGWVGVGQLVTTDQERTAYLVEDIEEGWRTYLIPRQLLCADLDQDGEELRELFAKVDGANVNDDDDEIVYLDGETPILRLEAPTDEIRKAILKVVGKGAPTALDTLASKIATDTEARERFAEICEEILRHDCRSDGDKGEIEILDFIIGADFSVYDIDFHDDSFPWMDDSKFRRDWTIRTVARWIHANLLLDTETRERLILAGEAALHVEKKARKAEAAATSFNDGDLMNAEIEAEEAMTVLGMLIDKHLPHSDSEFMKASPTDVIEWVFEFIGHKSGAELPKPTYSSREGEEWVVVTRPEGEEQESLAMWSRDFRERESGGHHALIPKSTLLVDQTHAELHEVYHEVDAGVSKDDGSILYYDGTEREEPIFSLVGAPSRINVVHQAIMEASVR